MMIGFECGVLALVAAFALASVGCNTKVHECNRLIIAINSNAEPIRSAGEALSAKDDSSTFDSAAVTFEKAADDVQAVDVKDESLKGFQRDYEAIFRDGAKSLREVSRAAKSNDAPGRSKAASELSAKLATEGDLVNRINAYCSK